MDNVLISSSESLKKDSKGTTSPTTASEFVLANMKHDDELRWVRTSSWKRSARVSKSHGKSLASNMVLKMNTVCNPEEGAIVVGRGKRVRMGVAEMGGYECKLYGGGC